MCGIIGFSGEGNAVPLIVEGLERLEYRGYDSAGVAVCGADGIKIVKQKGRLAVLKACLEKKPLSGSVGIGHTRWATHGEPSDANSHPHMGALGKIAVVHNGIIENYQQLRAMLEQKGVVFSSDTDSETIAQLAEYYYNGDILDTTITVTNMLEGSYALGILCTDEPNKLIAVKKDNPLIVGIGKNGNFIASDVPAILKHTNKVCYLGEKEIAVLDREGIQFFDIGKNTISKQPETITWSNESAEKGGYEHFMFKEIMEQPRVVKDTTASLLNGKNKDCLDKLDISRFNKIVITACGSAYNAGMVSRYVLETLTRIPVVVDLASEFRYRDAIIDSNSLVIIISQSGETADTIAAMREAKRKGATTLSIVNVVGSTIAKEADLTIYTVAGPEIAVATTKALSAQLVALYMLAVDFAFKANKIDAKERARLHTEISSIPDGITQIFKEILKIQQYAASCFNSKSIFFIGRNIDYAVAMEGSLKLKEISYIHSEAYAGGELKHGTISLIEENTLVVTIACHEKLFNKTLSNAEQVVSRGANVLLITGAEHANQHGLLKGKKTTHFAIPRIDPLFSPSLSVIILQLLSYYVAANKGCDIDKPRNLAKSVTVE